MTAALSSKNIYLERFLSKKILKEKKLKPGGYPQSNRPQSLWYPR